MKKKCLSENGGFSLIEVVIAMVLLALVYGTLFDVLTNQKFAAAKSEITVKSIFLCQELINRVIAKNFDENSEPPWTSTALLGVDAGDAYYDDVDDFAGYTNSNISRFPGFTEQVRVFYVDVSESLDDSVSASTDFKKIIVTISHNEMNDLNLETLVSSHY